MPSIWAELKRRNVVRIAVAYAVVAWLLIEVAATILPIFEAPQWLLQAFTLFVILGFPVALVLAWAYELTPEGVKREKNVDRSQSITPRTGRKLDFVIIGLLAVTVVFLIVDNYVFTGTYEQRAESAASQSVEVAAASDRSIAVLPFENLSPDAENAFFADGIHDDLLTQLAKISTLKVISRTSVLEYRDRRKNMRQIGQELGVATILDGGVRRAGDTIRFNARLIDAETDAHLWADSYDRQLTAENVFAIQREMATAIADALQATLSPEESARLAEVPTQNLSAYNFYLSGNDYIRRPDNLTAYSLAAQQYRRALDEDPDFALAWAALARAHSGVYFFRVDPSDSRREAAREAIERAFMLDPELPEAHLAMGYYRYHVFRDYPAALEEFAIAAAGMPGNSTVYLAQAYIYRRLGEFERSAASLERAIELDPRNLEQLWIQSYNYRMLRNYADAERYLDRALEIAPDNVDAWVSRVQIPVFRDGDVTLARSAAANPPFNLGDWRQWFGWLAALYARDYETALDYLDDWEIEVFNTIDAFSPTASHYGITYRLAGRPDQAEEQFRLAKAQIEAALVKDPEDPRLLVALGEVLAGLGEHDVAIDAARKAMALLPKSQDALSGSEIQINAIVRVLAPAGEAGTAIELLDDYLAAPGQFCIEGLLPDPRLDPIRDDPRFVALVEKYQR